MIPENRRISRKRRNFTLEGAGIKTAPQAAISHIDTETIMAHRSEEITEVCKNMAFGCVELSMGEKKFYADLNRQLVFLCNTLPEPVKHQATIFLFEYAGLTLGDEMDFFRFFHPPVWSIIYWIHNCDQCCRAPKTDEYIHSLIAHAMSLFLHSLDDHIHDGDIRASHLLLLLRSNAWILMNDSLKKLAEENPAEIDFIDSRINEYYAAILPEKKPESFEDYCALFKRQISTWIITPMLTIKKLICNDKFTADIKESYESFAVAWRLMDDLNDLEQDILDGTHNAVYYNMSAEGMAAWDSLYEGYPYSNDPEKQIEEIFAAIRDDKVVEKTVNRICGELKKASEIAEKHGINGLSGQYCALAAPLKSWIESE